MAAAASGSWHSAQGIFTNSTSDIVNVDNSAITTGTNAGPNFPSSVDIFIGNDLSNSLLDGFVAEAGIWPSGFNTSQQTAMYNNQHSYYVVF